MIILFVMTINIATLFTFLTFFFRQKLFPGKKVVMVEPGSTDDKFVITVEKNENMSDDEYNKIVKVMKEAGAVDVSERAEPDGYVNEEND